MRIHTLVIKATMGPMAHYLVNCQKTDDLSCLDSLETYENSSRKKKPGLMLSFLKYRIEPFNIRQKMKAVIWLWDTFFDGLEE